MSTIYIEWDKVVDITASGEFEVQTTDGRIVSGTIATAGPARLTVMAPDGPREMAFGSIVWIVPLHERFLKRLDGSLDLGFTYTNSSGVSQTTLNAKTVYRRPKHEVFGSVSSSITTQSEAATTDRESVRFGDVRIVKERWSFEWMGLLDRNRDIGLDLRETGAVGVGHPVVQNNRAALRLAGGIAVGREHPVDAPRATDVDAYGGLDFSYFTYDYPHTNLDLQILWFAGLKDYGRFRLEANSAVKRELIRDFYAAVSFYDSFDSRPRSPTASSNDFGVTISLGWSF